jgi:hypothetical protein
LSPRRKSRPDWPRLLCESEAAEYLSIGTTMLREKGPAPKRNAALLGSRVLWDRRDLDRWADALDGQPLDADDADAHARDVERQFLESRGRRG